MEKYVFLCQKFTIIHPVNKQLWAFRIPRMMQCGEDIWSLLNFVDCEQCIGKCSYNIVFVRGVVGQF